MIGLIAFVLQAAQIQSYYSHCSSSCSFHKIGDGICDLDCMIPSCDFDTGPSNISDCKETCENLGCGNNQIGNGNCDQQCNVQECGWDAGDCICGDFCQNYKLMNGKCDIECLVPDCNYDQSDCNSIDSQDFLFKVNSAKRWQAIQRDFSYGYDLGKCLDVSPKCTMIGNGTCDSSCNVIECLYDMDDCYPCISDCQMCVKGECLDCPGEFRLYDKCVSKCPSSHIPHYIYSNICYPRLDLYSSTSPHEIYVKSSEHSPLEDGSISNPYTSLSAAFSNIWSRHTIIYLLSSTIDLKPLSVLSLNTKDPKKPLSLSIDYSSLTISTYICNSNSNIHCLSSPATIMIKDSSIQLEIQSYSKVVIKDVIWNGSQGLVEECEEWHCTYCPYYKVDFNGITINDRSSPVDNSLWAKNCSIFKNYNFLNLSKDSEVLIENVEFIHFRQQLRSIIRSKGAKLDLKNVNFRYNQVSNTPGSAIILQELCEEAPYYCGSFSYDGGTVEFTNYGYELLPDTTFNGFLLADGLETIYISDVSFQHNIVFRLTSSVSSFSSLLVFKQFLSLKIEDCTFRYNWGYKGGAIMIQTDGMTLPLTNSLNQLTDSSSNDAFSHIIIKNSYFYNNVSTEEASAIYINFPTEFLNLHISDCHFENNISANSYGTLVIINASTLKPVHKEGGTIDSIYYSPRYAKLHNLTFHRNYYTGIASVYLNNLPNVDLKNISIEYSGQSEDTIGVNQIWVKEFITHNYYIIINLDGFKDPKSSGVLTVHKCYEVEVSNLNIAHNLCEDSNSGVTIIDNTGLTYLKHINIMNNTVRNDGISGLASINNEELRIFNFTISENSGNHIGTVYICNPNDKTHTLSSGKFLSNKSNRGGALNSEDTNLTLQNVTFESNSADESAGAYFSISRPIARTVSIFILDSKFLSNIATGEGVVTFNSPSRKVYTETSGVFYLNMDNTEFIDNSAPIGACIIFQENTRFDSSSIVMNSRFISNTATEYAAIITAMKGGNIHFVNVEFARNIGLTTSVFEMTHISIDKSSLVTFNNCTFTENSGVSVVLIYQKNSQPFVQFIETVFIHNTGSCLRILSGQANVLRSRFTSNHATEGGAMFISGAKVIANDTIFEENSSVLYGGAVKLRESGFLSCDKCIFQRNFSGKHGGAIEAEDLAYFHLKNSSCIYNRALQKGSCICSLSCGAYLTVIQDSYIAHNHGLISGAATFVEALLEIKGTTFSNNSVESALGGDFSATFGLSYIKNSTFIDGRAIMIYANIYSYVILEDIIIRNAKYSMTAAVFEVMSSFVNATNIYVEQVSGQEVALGSIHIKSVVQISNSVFKSLSANKVAGFDVMESTLILKNCKFYGVTQTAIYAIQSTVTLNSVDIENGVSQYEGTGLTCYNCLELYIINSKFLNLSSTSHGAGVYIENDEYYQKKPYLISNSTFDRCTARSGGAIYVNNANFTSSLSNFSDNSASITGYDGSGGAINLLCTSESFNCIHILTNNTFIDNYSSSKGGAVSWIDIMPQFQDNLYTNNQATYGNDIASFPIKLVVTFSRQVQNVNNFEVVPGQNSGITIHLNMIDHYGQAYTIDYTSTADLIGSESTEVNGEISVAADSFGFTFKDFTLFGAPDSRGVFEITSSAIPTNKQQRANDGMEYISSLLFNVSFRACVIGEYSDVKTCNVCEHGKYSLDPTEECKLCPSAAECYGNFTIMPKEGYWRSSNMSDIFYKCPNEDSCLGGIKDLSLTGECAIGYEGNLCNSCKEEYAKMRMFECLECRGKVENGVISAFVLVGLYAVSAVLIGFSLRTSFKSDSKVSIYLKIFINYLHITSECAALQLNWPYHIEEYFKYYSQAGDWSLQTFSIDCTLKQNYNSSNEDLMKLRLILLLSVPVLCILGYLFIWLFISLITRKFHYLRNQLILSIYIMFTIIQPTITKISFSIFACREIDDGEFWLDTDASIRCWSSTHTYYSLALGLPVVIIWSLGMPLGIFSMLMHYRKKLNETDTRIKLGYFYNGYRSNTFYWEFLIILRKMLIIFCSVFLLPDSPQMQSLPILLILTIAFILQVKVKPFVSDDLNRLEVISIMIGIITIYLGLYFLLIQPEEGVEYFIFTVILISNGFFLVIWLKYLIFGFSSRVLTEGHVNMNQGQKYLISVSDSQINSSYILPISDMNSNSEIHYISEDSSMQAPFNTFSERSILQSDLSLSNPNDIEIELSSMIPHRNAVIHKTALDTIKISETDNHVHSKDKAIGKFLENRPKSKTSRNIILTKFESSLKISSDLETDLSNPISLQKPIKTTRTTLKRYEEDSLNSSRDIEMSSMIAPQNTVSLEGSDEEYLSDSDKSMKLSSSLTPESRLS